MTYVNPQLVERAKSIDLVTYLKNYHPENLMKIARNHYCTVDHDSLKMANGLWHWFSRGVGGKNVIDYLMTVYDYKFQDAVIQINSEMDGKDPVFEKFEKVSEGFQLPPKNSDYKAVMDYLMKRGIDSNIIANCIYKDILYEDKDYHNVVFVGKDKDGVKKYASKRGTSEKRFHQEVMGSDKSFSFSLNMNEYNNSVHIFESPIDLLSYATLIKLHDKDWAKENYLSLGGVYKSDQLTAPLALQQYLSDRTNIDTIVLHLDNDAIGIGAAKQINDIYSNKYNVINKPPTSGKDVNEYLTNYLNKHKERNDAR